MSAVVILVLSNLCTLGALAWVIYKSPDSNQWARLVLDRKVSDAIDEYTKRVTAVIPGAAVSSREVMHVSTDLPDQGSKGQNEYVQSMVYEIEAGIRDRYRLGKRHIAFFTSFYENEKEGA